MASARQAASASRAAEATTPSTDDRSAPGPSNSTARRHNAATSEAPNRQRGPVRTRIAATPAVGSAASRNIATTSATSGMPNSPPSPTTSTGTPRAVSASAMGAASALRRTRTAVVGTGAPDARASSHRRVTWSATQARSLDDVRRQRAPDVARPRVRPGHQFAHGHRPPPRLGGDRVGQLQGPRRVAPAGA